MSEIHNYVSLLVRLREPVECIIDFSYLMQIYIIDITIPPISIICLKNRENIEGGHFLDMKLAKHLLVA